MHGGQRMRIANQQRHVERGRVRIRRVADISLHWRVSRWVCFLQWNLHRQWGWSFNWTELRLRSLAHRDYFSDGWRSARCRSVLRAYPHQHIDARRAGIICLRWSACNLRQFHALLPHLSLYSHGVLMTCEHFQDGRCVHPEAVAQYGPDPSPGTHKVCSFNTTGGTWPVMLTVSAPRPRIDPAVRAHVQKQLRGCRGCGDGLPEGMR